MKIWYIGIVTISFLLSTAGCGFFSVSKSAQNTVQSSTQPSQPPSNPANETNQSKPPVLGSKYDTARYNGQIDGNSIEVKISGTTEGQGIQALRLNDKVREVFDSYKLNTGDTIKFEFYLNEYGQKVVTKIEVIGEK